MLASGGWIILYSQAQLDEIRSQLKQGNRRFELGKFKCLFSASSSDNTLIQRIPNIFLGLAYVLDADEFIFNYPHINNIREEEIEGVNGIVQPKLNGTNIGIMKTKNGLIYRTRGSIMPERFINDINTRITLNENLAGINEEVFSRFREAYAPILKVGRERGLIDDYGCIVLLGIMPGIIKELEPFMQGDNLLGVFGEFISKYNVISVDAALRYGNYLGMEEDYNLVLFDLLIRDNDGNVVLEPRFGSTSFKNLKSKTIKVVEGAKLSNIKESLARYESEEGIMVKGGSVEIL